MKKYGKIGLAYIVQLLAVFWQPFELPPPIWFRIIGTEIIIGFMVLIYVMVNYIDDV